MASRPPDRILPERPTLDHEVPFWRSGFSRVAGVDEVGRGALAGPLVAAAVVLPSVTGASARRLVLALGDIRDSKLMTAPQREAAVDRIVACALAFATVAVEADELDRVGVSAANRLAMERAVDRLGCPADALLIDARTVEHDAPQVGLIKGDRHSLSIACAAILAKVHRDALMRGHCEVDGRYRFSVNKGYGTPTHLEALRTHGPGPLHRLSFRLDYDTGGDQ